MSCVLVPVAPLARKSTFSGDFPYNLSFGQQIFLIINCMDLFSRNYLPLTGSVRGSFNHLLIFSVLMQAHDSFTFEVMNICQLMFYLILKETLIPEKMESKIICIPTRETT